MGLGYISVSDGADAQANDGYRYYWMLCVTHWMAGMQLSYCDDSWTGAAR